MVYLFSILLFLLPLLVFPFGQSFFELPKVILAEILIQAGLIIFFLTHKDISLKHFDRTIIAIVVLFFSFGLGSLLFLAQKYTFFGNPFRLQGVLLFWYLLIFTLLSSKFDSRRLHGIFPLIGLIGIFMGSLFLGVNQDGRAYGTLGEPNALAASALFLWPFVYFKFNSRPVKFLSLLLAFLVVLFSGSRSGLIGLLGQGALLFGINYLKFNLRQVIFISVILLALGLLLPAQESNLVYENRVEIWKTALWFGKSHLLGTGIGNIDSALKESSNNLNNNVKFQYVDSSHNLILDFWVQMGVLGITLLFVMLYKSVKNYSQEGNYYYYLLWFGVLNMMLFNPASVVTLIHFWYLVGQGFHKPPD